MKLINIFSIHYHFFNYPTFLSKVKKSTFKERLQEVKGQNNETSQENSSNKMKHFNLPQNYIIKLSNKQMFI
jgi:hypothetical protein